MSNETKIGKYKTLEDAKFARRKNRLETETTFWTRYVIREVSWQMVLNGKAGGYELFRYECK